MIFTCRACAMEADITRAAVRLLATHKGRSTFGMRILTHGDEDLIFVEDVLRSMRVESSVERLRKANKNAAEIPDVSKDANSKVSSNCVLSPSVLESLARPVGPPPNWREWMTFVAKVHAVHMVTGCIMVHRATNMVVRRRLGNGKNHTRVNWAHWFYTLCVPSAPSLESFMGRRVGGSILLPCSLDDSPNTEDRFVCIHPMHRMVGTRHGHLICRKDRISMMHKTEDDIRRSVNMLAANTIFDRMLQRSTRARACKYGLAPELIDRIDCGVLYADIVDHYSQRKMSETLFKPVAESLEIEPPYKRPARCGGSSQAWQLLKGMQVAP